jgi:hypothetical protein
MKTNDLLIKLLFEPILKKKVRFPANHTSHISIRSLTKNVAFVNRGYKKQNQQKKAHWSLNLYIATL